MSLKSLLDGQKNHRFLFSNRISNLGSISQGIIKDVNGNINLGITRLVEEKVS
jgi:hypothetical protein